MSAMPEAYDLRPVHLKMRMRELVEMVTVAKARPVMTR